MIGRVTNSGDKPILLQCLRNSRHPAGVELAPGESLDLFAEFSAQAILEAQQEITRVIAKGKLEGRRTILKVRNVATGGDTVVINSLFAFVKHRVAIQWGDTLDLSQDCPPDALDQCQEELHRLVGRRLLAVVT